MMKYSLIILFSYHSIASVIQHLMKLITWWKYLPLYPKLVVLRIRKIFNGMEVVWYITIAN